MVIAPVVALMVAASIAGHPTQVACDVSETGPLWGYTEPSRETVIHLRGTFCVALAGPLRGELFPHAVLTLIHESAHQKGVRSEPCAELYANLGVYQVLRDFWNVSFFTPLSRQIGHKVHAITLTSGPQYQWDWTSCDSDPAPATAGTQAQHRRR